MTKYINLDRIEFVVTNACRGNCKHCSEGERLNLKGCVNAEASVDVVKKLTKKFNIESVMTFGGEPLLYAETTCAIHKAAWGAGIPVRQLITNGFFSKDEKRINQVAELICETGVNDILISVDAFHQEIIPLEPVMMFAESLVKNNAESVRVHPAWVVNETHENPYNTETKRLLNLFINKGFIQTDGNNIFPSGAALKHLSEYFLPPEKLDLTIPCGSMPYTGRLDEITCFGIVPNGDIRLCSTSIGNIYENDIFEIIDNYEPFKNPATKAVLEGGVSELLRYAQTQSISIDISNCLSVCEVCRKIMEKLND